MLGVAHSIRKAESPFAGESHWGRQASEKSNSSGHFLCNRRTEFSVNYPLFTVSRNRKGSSFWASRQKHLDENKPHI